MSNLRSTEIQREMMMYGRVKTVIFLMTVMFGMLRAGLSDEAYSGGMLDRTAALAAAAGVSSEAYPDAEEVLVAGMQRTRYEPDGTYTQWQAEFTKILTEDARRRHSTISSHFTIPYQRGPEDCVISLVEIIRPDGTVIPIDVEAQSRIMIDSSSMDKNIYNPNDKIIRVNVSGLSIGDVLHFVMFDRIVQPRMRDTWAEYYVLESERPIVSQAIEIDAPQACPLRSIALKDEVEGTVTHQLEERGERILYRWQAQNVPRMFPEPNMPPAHTVVQRLLVGTVPDWETISRWYWGLSEPHFEATTPMKAKVAELTHGMTNDLEKTEALFAFVSQDIRYMGITVEATAPGYEPHDVKDTFEAQHGVCRDKAALLVVMLRLAGLEAFPTLIHAGTKKDEEVPQPYFNHAIVSVRLKDGSYQLMDPTDETTKQLFPSYLSDKSYLVATPEGDRLRTSPIDPAEDNLMRIETHGKLDAQGGLAATTMFTFNGINDNAYRGYFARSRPEDRRRLFEGLIKAAAPGARLDRITFTPEDMMDVSTTLVVTVAFEAADVLIRSDELAALPVPAFGMRVGMVNFIIGQTGLKERKYPLVTDIACGVHETLELELDKSLDTPEAIPAAPALDNDELSWSLHMQQVGTSFQMEADLRLHVVEFAPPKYQMLKETLREIELALRKMPVFSLKGAGDGAGGDTVVLSDDTEYQLQDHRHWTETRTVKRKILTYAGKKRHGELKLDYNSALEDVSLVSAVVTGPDGKRTEIRPEEINVMDASWVGSARRYPPGRTLVASFPAVDIGSVIDYTYRRTVKEAPFFALHQSFGGLDAVVSKRVRVAAPPSVNMQVHRSAIEGVITEVPQAEGAAGAPALEWRAMDLKPVKPEERLPPWWSFNPTVFLSAAGWEDYASETHHVLKAAASHQKAARSKAKELTKGERDAWKKLTAIRNYVAVHVRLAGPGLHDLPLSAITSADETLREGYGNTTDRAVVLFAMLQAAGFDPEFLLASVLPAVPAFRDTVYRSRDPQFFSDVLVRVRDRSLGLEQETYVYLNDTDQYAAIGVSPHEGNLCLRLPSGTIEEIRPSKTARSEVFYSLAVNARGDTDLTCKRLIYGSDFGSENKRFSEITPEERKRFYQELVAEISQSAEATSELQTDFSVYPGVIEYSVHVPQFAVRDGDFLYFAFPESLAALLPVRSDTRVGPFYLAGKYRGRLTMEATVPQDFGVRILAAPLSLDNVAGAGICVRQTSVERVVGERRCVVVEAEASFDPAVIDARRYSEVLDLNRTVSHKRARTVVLKRKK